MSKSPPPRQRIGVLDVHALVYEDETGQPHWLVTQPEAVPDALSLLTVMERRGLSQLWVHPSYAAAKQLDLWPADSYYRLARMTEWKLIHAPNGAWVLGYHEGVYGGRMIYFPHRENRAAWKDAADANELLRALHLFEDVCGGRPYRQSPGAMGTYLMRAVHQGTHATRLDVPGEMPLPARAGGTEYAYTWLRALTPDELTRPYVHAYDRNGAFLAACASLPLGVGAAEHRADADAARDAYHMGRAPGYYRVTAKGPMSLRAGLPNPLTDFHRATDEGAYWVSLPTLSLLFELWPVSIHEAYVWPQTAQYLQPWYKLAREGRKQLMVRAAQSDHAAAIALAVLKRMYVMSFGWLAGSWQEDAAAEGHAGTLYRPDWRHAVIAQANANLYRRLVQWAKEQPDSVPFAINHDAVYVASDAMDAGQAAPSSLKLGDGLGEWKVTASGIPMEHMRAVLQEPGATLPAFLAALAAWQRRAAGVTA